MKVLAMLTLFLSVSAWAGSWVSVEPDRSNLLYREGERASFIFRKLLRPVSPEFSINTKISVNGGGEKVIEYLDVVGAFSTEALEGGETNILIVTKILGPSGFEKTVQSDSIQLTVNSGGN